jgi:hypothetical protein
MRHVEKTPTCWLWTAKLNYYGYGHFNAYDSIGKRLGAHRMAWLLLVGPIPAGKMVLHKCDVPRCVRPMHLYIGTTQDNSRDYRERGKRAA